MVDWREVEGKYGTMYFTDADSFLSAKESEIAVEIRRTYENFKNTKKPENMAKKGDRYQPEWTVDDNEQGWRYKATYDDRYGWGVIRTEIKKKPAAAREGQSTLATSNVEAELQTINARLKDIQTLDEEIRDLLKVIAGFFVEKGIKSAEELKKERAQADQAAAAADEEEDDEVANEGF